MKTVIVECPGCSGDGEVIAITDGVFTSDVIGCPYRKVTCQQCGGAGMVAVEEGCVAEEGLDHPS